MPTKTRVYNWYISLVAAACMVLYGYDASVYNSVQGSKHWVAYFNSPSPNMIGLINSVYTVGAIIGGFFFGGPIADFFGRKVGMGTGCVLVIIATFVQAFSPRGSIGTFMAGRIIIGFGQGIALVSGPIYIGELAPSHIRGKIMSFWQLFYSVGSFICFWVAYACSEHIAALGEWDWKMTVIFQILVPLIVLTLLPFMPGTPRWYLKKNGDIEKARNALRRVRDTDEEVEAELMEIREALEFEKEISSSYSALWKDPSVRKRLMIAFVLNAGQQITGQGSLNSYSTKIYQKVFQDPQKIMLINALNATCGIIFTLNAVWTVDRFGRKFLLIVGGIGMGLCMIVCASVETQTPTLEGGAKSQPVSIAIVFLLFLFIFFYKPSWGATIWIWTSEIFSTNVRAQAVGMCAQMQNVANCIVNQFFPIFLKKCGFYAFYMFAGINFLLALFVYFVVPETKQVKLEEMDTLFGGQNHIDKGANMMGYPSREASMAGQGGQRGDEINEVREIGQQGNKSAIQHTEHVNPTKY